MPDVLKLDPQRPPPTRWAVEPTLREVLFLVALTALLFVVTLSSLRPFFFMVRTSGDAAAYAEIASAIRHWSFEGLVIKAFWGLPYAMALVSMVTRISDFAAYFIISFLAGVSAVVLAWRLWGGWVAGFFVVLSLDWMQKFYLGGGEPLFTALLFGAFLAVRKKRWVLASLLASFGTIVRPLGLFSLVAIGFALLWQREYRNLAKAILVGVTVGGLYSIPMILYFHSPFANVNTYRAEDWEAGRLLSWPFHAFLRTSLSGRVPWTNLVLTWSWIVFAFAGLLALLLAQRNRQCWRRYPVEVMFTLAYFFILYTYNSPQWALGNFPRFVIPVIPIILVALGEWIPRDRRLVWGLAVVCPVLAACSAVGIRNVAQILRGALR